MIKQKYYNLRIKKAYIEKTDEFSTLTLDVIDIDEKKGLTINITIVRNGEKSWQYRFFTEIVELVGITQLNEKRQEKVTAYGREKNVLVLPQLENREFGAFLWARYQNSPNTERIYERIFIQELFNKEGYTLKEVRNQLSSNNPTRSYKKWAIENNKIKQNVYESGLTEESVKEYYDAQFRNFVQKKAEKEGSKNDVESNVEIDDDLFIPQKLATPKKQTETKAYDDPDEIPF